MRLRTLKVLAVFVYNLATMSGETCIIRDRKGMLEKALHNVYKTDFWRMNQFFS